MVEIDGQSLVLRSNADSVLVRLALPNGTNPRWHSLQLAVNGTEMTPVLNGVAHATVSTSAMGVRLDTDEIALGCMPTVCARTAIAVELYASACQVCARGLFLLSWYLHSSTALAFICTLVILDTLPRSSDCIPSLPAACSVVLSALPRVYYKEEEKNKR